ncbi:B12-binding domain-containing radical SAM protein [Candidatus Hakubella thermalkaliphila]|uniref:Uncharacterized protein n=1 Tax=Candidatus Hakubella thermalkaliphila TaxID=2754717 RepID=A0A6V8QAA3_9ACTN|nr:radical SAM protein [Candidatus Hakubella thermalkaliphila]MBT9167978.1 2-hydroxyethylphosphonate methyltransferase [Bacillota bacterium]GFP28017.1 hypothetical protein HKBW3S33_01434 [Candidatus Hakubella thermalkaliphila]GFP40934.1 hypothetical protein HKBW3C_00059 [Candidatus Hakubella thermalkaliphila]
MIEKTGVKNILKNKMARVLFVIPRVKSLFGDEYARPGHPHVGIAYLSAYLKQDGIAVAIFDAGVENGEEALGHLIHSFEPELIGVTVFSYCYHLAEEVIQTIRTYTQSPIVVGGPHVSATKGEILENRNIDFAIKGEGEITLLELVRAIQNGERGYGKIDGLVWRDGGHIVENPDRPYINDLDALPFPDYEAFDLAKYLNTAEEKRLPLITSRGCPYGCNFCSVRLSMGRRFRPRSPENTVEEIAYWYEKGWWRFDINDDCFNLDLQRALRICNLILERGLKISYQLYNGIRADRVTKELLERMKKSGCNFLSYGCESGNDKILKVIKKGLTLEKVRQAVAWSNEVGIRNSVNFIIGHPHETYQTAIETIDFARSLPTDFVNMYNLVPYPGTDLYHWIKQNGRFLVDEKTYLSGIAAYDDNPIFETKEFPREERVKALKKGRALYERRVIQFRLGKTLGYLGYLLMRIRPLAQIGRTLVLSNKLGNKIYLLLSRGSRE